VTESEADLYGVRSVALMKTASGNFERTLCKQVSVFGETYKIMRHPDLLVGRHIWKWIEDYEYTEEYKIPIPHEERHPAWLDFRKYWKEINK